MTLPSFQVVLAGTLLHAHLADAVIDARGLDDAGACGGLQRQRLLHVGVFASVERAGCDGRMPVIGHGDQRGVDFLEIEHLAVIV